uniref:Uncharacterized protein n=1 Tax=Macaca fascicularis TaxID=9541 RepID=A0A7N9ICV9_MACFA
VCFRIDLGLLSPYNLLQMLLLCLLKKNISRVHVHNAQVCYICIHVPCLCAAPINSSCPQDSSFVEL